jgi:hypothetical protein
MFVEWRGIFSLFVNKQSTLVDGSIERKRKRVAGRQGEKVTENEDECERN